MSVRDGPRPVRNLAAWGYESDGPGGSGDRLEVDVWTVNAVESPEPLPDPEDVAGSVEAVLALAGNIAKVEYAGAAGVGYQYVDPSAANDPDAGPFDATQNAFAGAARAAGGSRTDSGTFGPGAEPAVVGPDIAEVRRHGEREVLPVVAREFADLGTALVYESGREEDEEDVTSRPFDGFENVVRVMTRGSTFRYTVRNGRLTSGGRGP
jgi:hypothetical protein